MKTIRSLAEIPEMVKLSHYRARIAVVTAEDDNTIDAVIRATNDGIIEPVLIGDERKIREMAEERSFPLRSAMVIHNPDHASAADEGVRLVKNGEAEILSYNFV